MRACGADMRFRRSLARAYPTAAPTNAWTSLSSSYLLHAPLNDYPVTIALTGSSTQGYRRGFTWRSERATGGRPREYVSPTVVTG